jgi:hypothetical protein
MVDMRIESNLMGSVDSFMDNRRVRMAIDGCELAGELPVEDTVMSERDDKLIYKWYCVWY